MYSNPNIHNEIYISNKTPTFTTYCPYKQSMVRESIYIYASTHNTKRKNVFNCCPLIVTNVPSTMLIKSSSSLLLILHKKKFELSYSLYIKKSCACVHIKTFITPFLVGGPVERYIPNNSCPRYDKESKLGSKSEQAINQHPTKNTPDFQNCSLLKI